METDAAVTNQRSDGSPYWLWKAEFWVLSHDEPEHVSYWLSLDDAKEALVKELHKSKLPNEDVILHWQENKVWSYGMETGDGVVMTINQCVTRRLSWDTGFEQIVNMVVTQYSFGVTYRPQS